METDLDYLAPHFDPSSLTVPRLRSILVSHSVDYPSSAKKAQLVEIFNENIVPQSRKILAARSRTKRTSKGITDAESSQDSVTTGNEEDEDTLLPPPLDPSNLRESRGRRRVTEGPVIDAPRPRGPLQGSSSDKRPSYKHPRESDAEMSTGAESKRPMVRKMRRSDMAPAVVPTVEEDQQVEVPSRTQFQEDSVFSDDNPFQSGSSPVGGSDRRISTGKRKKSLGPPGSKDRGRRESKTRSSTAQDGIVVPTAKNFNIQVGRRKEEPDQIAVIDEIEPGEEFTPEEQLDLVQEQLKAGVKDLLSTRQTGRQSRGGRWSKSAPWIVLLALLGGYATWWRREKLDVGYCGIGRPSTAVAAAYLPEWAALLQPQCEPCPPHAYCFSDLQTSCEPNFVLKPHPLSVGGLIPLVPTCEPDGERARRVKSVADRAVEELRNRRAKYECGELSAKDGKAANVEMDEEGLKEAVGQKRRKTMNNAEFEELWRGALGEMMGMDEVVTGVDS